MKISGLVFLVIGIVVILFSLFVQSVNPEANLIFFIIAGGLFIAYGVFKLVSKVITGTDPKDAQKPVISESIVQKLVKNKDLEAVNMQMAQRQKPTITVCSRCGSKNYSTNNFCYNCGNRLK